ncbi:hypothetical protein P7K49_037899 [Saguinus oedipus]|uniref:Uncharacterized protein n=1 Tax=Saguinus oedipus TaxID=9490 RepID=A0ABQ9TJH1_SAGOE|nr:hypothetical protein P7K49_037899 [Saguinus oedipus]
MGLSIRKQPGPPSQKTPCKTQKKLVTKARGNSPGNLLVASNPAMANGQGSEPGAYTGQKNAPFPQANKEDEAGTGERSKSKQPAPGHLGDGRDRRRWLRQAGAPPAAELDPEDPGRTRARTAGTVPGGRNSLR